jgi:hypothetical protein
MITVYHVPNSRSLRIVWLMEELGEEYGLERLTMPIPESFKQVNPLGCVPAIDDDGIRMFESLAILQYITGRRLVAGDKPMPSTCSSCISARRTSPLPSARYSARESSRASKATPRSLTSLACSLGALPSSTVISPMGARG